MFHMTLDCYISSFTNITGYVVSLTKTLFINEYANVIIIYVFLFALVQQLTQFSLFDDDHRSACHFANIYTSDSLVH
jgi:hypothetical protein